MLPSPKKLSGRFMPHKLAWIEAEVAIHDQYKQVVALVEKSGFLLFAKMVQYFPRAGLAQIAREILLNFRPIPSLELVEKWLVDPLVCRQIDLGRLFAIQQSVHSGG